MQTSDLLIEDAMSVEAVFAAVQCRLPPSDEPVEGYSEIVLANASGLKRRLALGDWVIVSYTHHWLKAWDRLSPLLNDWMLLSSVASLAILVGCGALGQLPRNEAATALLVFGGGILAGLGIAARYTGIMPPMVHHSVTIIDGRTRELIYACRLSNDKQVDRLIRVPIDEVALWFRRVQLADHASDDVELRLGSPTATAGTHCEWPDVFIFTAPLRDRVPLPENLEVQARGLSQALGVQYLGLQG